MTDDGRLSGFPSIARCPQRRLYVPADASAQKERYQSADSFRISKSEIHTSLRCEDVPYQLAGLIGRYGASYGRLRNLSSVPYQLAGLIGLAGEGRSRISS